LNLALDAVLGRDSRDEKANTPIDLATKTFAFLKPYAGGTKG
jgi:hypothetical protein